MQLNLGTSETKSKKKNNLHEDHKEEAEVHGQVKQVTNKLQIESIYWLPFPLTFHDQISDIEGILHNHR